MLHLIFQYSFSQRARELG